MRKNLLLIFALLTGFSLSAQHQCGFDQKQEELLADNPQYRAEMAKMKTEWMDYISSKSQHASRAIITGTDTIYEIPVVVHVFHTGEAVGHNYNKSEATIQAWLDYTNEIYAATATGYVGAGAGGTVIPVRLVLAKRDESCNATSGIVRVNGSTIPGYSAGGLNRSSAGGASEASLKATSRWDANNYYNIYIVTQIDGWDGYSAGSGVAGYAGFPSNSNYNYSTFLFSSVVSSTSDVMAHEFGHSMGLYHTFASSTGPTFCSPVESDCSSEGDEVCDTERHPLVFTCPSMTDINPCTSVAYEGAQYNVMAYGSCPNRFTPGQKDRAVFMLKKYRNSLLLSLGAVDPPTGTAPTAASTTCFPTSIGTPGFNMGPTFVGFNNIAVASQGYSGDGGRYYIDYSQEVCQYSASHTEVDAEVTYPLQFTVAGLNDQYVKAYIDYDNSGTFEAAEQIYASSGRLAEGTYSTGVTIPATATKNVPLRLRVIADFSSFTSACSDREYGQTEDFTVTIVSPLAQSIISFDAINNNCQNIVSWKMNDCKEVAYFDIEKSTDGQNFKTVSTIQPTENQKEYAITDFNKENGVVIYRLAVQLTNGNKLFSTMAKVTDFCNNGFHVYPNPSTNNVQIKYLSNGKATTTITVIDVTGKVLVAQQSTAVKGENEWTVDLKNIPAGAYILKVSTENGSHQEVIVKQ